MLDDDLGIANASSAKAFVTLWFRFWAEFLTLAGFCSKGNLFPGSCNNEKLSRAGNRVDTSSRFVSAPLTFPGVSRILKGSSDLSRRGDLDCFGVLESPSALIGLPRLIGVISLMGVVSGTINSSLTTLARYAPAATGGEPTLGDESGRYWLRRASE